MGQVQLAQAQLLRLVQRWRARWVQVAPLTWLARWVQRAAQRVASERLLQCLLHHATNRSVNQPPWLFSALANKNESAGRSVCTAAASLAGAGRRA
jgi:hypothetical protein